MKASEIIVKPINKIAHYSFVTVSAIVYSGFNHVIHSELTNHGGWRKVLSNMLAYFAKQPGPLANMLNEVAELVNEVNQDGNLKEVLEKKVATEVDRCAGETVVNKDEAATLVKCFFATPNIQGDLMEKGVAFATCAGINPFNFTKEMTDAAAIMNCVASDARAIAKQSRDAITQISKEGHVNYFAEVITQIENNSELKVRLQQEAKTEIAKCAHTIGGDVDKAEKSFVCFTAMLQVKDGVMQKLQSFAVCDNLTPFDAINEMHNTMILAQCVIKDLSQEVLVGVSATVVD